MKEKKEGACNNIEDCKNVPKKGPTSKEELNLFRLYCIIRQMGDFARFTSPINNDCEITLNRQSSCSSAKIGRVYKQSEPNKLAIKRDGQRMSLEYYAL